LRFLSLDQNSQFYGTAKFGQFRKEKNPKMTISKTMFAPSTPYKIYFEFLKSGPNDSTRVRRFTGILRRARVKIFIVAYRSFWYQISVFSSDLTGHHETKTAKPIWSCRSKYSNFYVKPRPPMSTEDVLNRFRTFRAVKLQPVWLYRYERCLISPKRTCDKTRKLASLKFL
jgi:hypothetical protein